ncbi:MAG TPA: DUF2007 domain-containing protein [Bacteroidota bacterium]
MGLRYVKNFPDRLYAERAQQTLEEEGIPSVIQSPDAGILGAGATAGLPQGADLYVEEEFYVQAREILNELFDGI